MKFQAQCLYGIGIPDEDDPYEPPMRHKVYSTYEGPLRDTPEEAREDIAFHRKLKSALRRNAIRRAKRGEFRRGESMPCLHISAWSDPFYVVIVVWEQNGAG